jgi:hypothetical protein
MKIVRIPARIFFALITFCGLAVAAVVTRHTAHLLCFEVGFELRTVVFFFFYFWTYLFTVHRLWLWRFPLKSGEVVPESSQETVLSSKPTSKHRRWAVCRVTTAATAKPQNVIRAKNIRAGMRTIFMIQ